MTAKCSIENRFIGDGFPVFIVAELGSNHDGKLKQAKELIDVAAEAGCDAVKIQVPVAAECYPPGTKFGGHYGDVEITEVIRNNEIPPEWMPELVSYAHEKELVIGASTDGFIGLEQMLQGGVDFIKIPSFALSHIPLLKACAKTGKPILLSSGSHRLASLEEAITAVCPLTPAVFHCVSAYPAPLDDLNLKTIPFLKEAFDIPIGFSDHSIHPTRGPTLAIALGANMLEKHYTLDRKLVGTDHFFALEPNELKEMVSAARRVECDPERKACLLGDPDNAPLLGHIRRGIFDAEEAYHQRTRVSVYFLRAMREGQTIDAQDLRVLRCADTEPGLHPRYLDLVVGCKLTRDAVAYEGLTWDHVLSR